MIKEAISSPLKERLLEKSLWQYLDGPTEKPGRGSLHHLSNSREKRLELAYWEETVKQRGFPSSGNHRNVSIFKSLYFANQTESYLKLRQMAQIYSWWRMLEHLGEKLDLANHLEGQRAEIEANLAPIERE